MSSRHVIATVVVGTRFRRLHRRAFAPSLERYAARHGYELVVVERPLLGRAGADELESGFSRYLLPTLSRVASADRLLYVDGDMLVPPGAPPFHELDLADGIGVVDEWSQPDREGRSAYQAAHGFEATARAYHASAGFDSEIATVINSGCYVCEPRRHAAWLEAFARRHAPIAAEHPRGPHYEQSAFGMSLHREGLATLLPERWNRIWPVHRWSEGRSRRDGDPRARLAAVALVRRAMAEGVFLHFTAGLDHDLAAASQRMSPVPTGSSST